MARRIVAAIVAMDEERIIGSNGRLPWHLPEDMSHFKALTIGGVVVMGRKTWDSLPARFRPLPDRINIVVTRNPAAIATPEGVYVMTSVDAALELAQRVGDTLHRIWIIGGAEIYRAALPYVDELHLTHVYGVHSGDATFPPFEDAFDLISESAGDVCSFKVYRRR